MLTGKRILLVISGGIAAYKSLELVRRLRDRNATVRAVMTAAAKQFVTPLSVSALTGEKVFDDLFNLTDEAEMGHIELSRDADLIVVAPATANLLAKMANGFADDMASTVLLATDTPVMAAPAMNVRMWTHPATARNVDTLAADGVLFVGPDDGTMACGEFGPGRLAEPSDILSAIEAFFAMGGALSGGPLSGKRVVITSGPTHEPIDPVRYIANRSSGKQGHAIAAAAARAGAEVELISGPVALADPPGVVVTHVQTAREMLDAVTAALPADVAIFAAAVADWRAARESAGKIKKDGSGTVPALELEVNPDILATVGHLGRDRPGLVIGFAAETDDLLANARAKLERKGADWIVANDVSPETGIMGGDANTVRILDAKGVEEWPSLSKDAVAEALVGRIAGYLEAHEEIEV